MCTPLRILVVDDSVEETVSIIREIQRGGFHVEFELAETAASTLDALRESNWDLLLTNPRMSQAIGPEAMEALQQKGEEVPLIFVAPGVGDRPELWPLQPSGPGHIGTVRLESLLPTVERELQINRERHPRTNREAVSTYLASIVQSCEDAIIGKTLDGSVVSWNAGAERLYGYTAEEMIGRPISILLSPYRPNELSEIMRAVQRGDHLEAYETVRIRKDGRPVEVSVTVSPIRDERGHIIGASSVARDITRRKQDERERLGLIGDLTAALTRSHGATATEVGGGGVVAAAQP